MPVFPVDHMSATPPPNIEKAAPLLKAVGHSGRSTILSASSPAAGELSCWTWLVDKICKWVESIFSFFRNLCTPQSEKTALEKLSEMKQVCEGYQRIAHAVEDGDQELLAYAVSTLPAWYQEKFRQACGASPEQIAHRLARLKPALDQAVKVVQYEVLLLDKESTEDRVRAAFHRLPQEKQKFFANALQRQTPEEAYAFIDKYPKHVFFQNLVISSMEKIDFEERMEPLVKITHF